MYALKRIIQYSAEVFLRHVAIYSYTTSQCTFYSTTLCLFT